MILEGSLDAFVFIKITFLVHSGEFTLRAFLNGRLDLSQVENVGKLISAKSAIAADAALAGLQACFSR